mgnify:CR=1 FL=1
MSATLRIAAAIAIAVWVIVRAGPDMILDAALSIHVLWLVVAFAFIIAESFAKTLNWQAILGSILRRPLAWGPLLKAYLIASFLGTVVPSSMGTDALRALHSKACFGGLLAGHAASVIIANIFNLVVSSFMALTAALWLEAQGAIPLSMQVLPLLFAGVACGFPVLYILLKWRRDALVVGLRRLRTRRWFKVRHSLRRFIDSMLIFNNSGSSPLRFLVISILAVVMQTAVWVTLGRGLDVQLPLAVWMLMVPANAIVGILPLSIAGFGFHQAAHVAILAAFGVEPSTAVVISALLSLFAIVFNVGLGGCAFLISGKARPDYVRTGEGATRA